MTEYEEGVIWTGNRRHMTRAWSADTGDREWARGTRQAVCNRNTFTYPLEKINKYRKTPVDMASVPKCSVCLKKFPEWS